MNAVYILFILFTFVGGGNAFVIPRTTTVSDTEANNPNNVIPRNTTVSDTEANNHSILLYKWSSLILYQLYFSFVVEILSLFACWLMTDLKVFTDKAWLMLATPMLLLNASGIGIDLLTFDGNAHTVLAWIAVGNYVLVTEILWTMVVSSYPFYSLLKRTKSISSTPEAVQVQHTSSFALVRVASKILLLLTISCPGILVSEGNLTPESPEVRFGVVKIPLHNLEVVPEWLLVMVKYQITPSILLVFLTFSFASCLRLRKHSCCHPKDASWSVYSNRQKFHTLSGVFLSLLTSAQFLTLYFEIWAFLKVFLVQHLAATSYFMTQYFSKEMGIVVPSLQDQQRYTVHTKFI